jgi:hypothetical protein
MWNPPSLSLIWPPFFRFDMNEEQQMVTTAALAVQGNLITRRMALEKLRSVYPFENIDAVSEQLEEQVEQTASQNVEHLLTKAMKTEESDAKSTKQEAADEDEEAASSR